MLTPLSTIIGPIRKICLPCLLGAICFATPTSLFDGLFDNDSGIAETEKAGRVDFNASTLEYSVTGAGGDIAGTSDGFHYVWKKVTGDVVINADARFAGNNTADYARAALMIRQSLDPGATYAAAVLRGDGQAALQYRPDAGATSKAVQLIASANLTSPLHLSLTRHGDAFSMSAGRMGKMGGPLPFAPPVTLTMNGPVYVGLAVSSHDPAAQQTAVFSNVTIQSF